MRTLPVLLLAAGIVASLSSCATAPFSVGCDSDVTSGPASSVVTATGKFGATPTVNFPTPIVTKTLERSELITGTGPELATGNVVLMKFTFFNGTTGEIVAQGDYSGIGDMITLADSVIPSITDGLQCATVGSRVVIATNALDAGQDPATVTDSFVFIIDIIDAFPAKAFGVPQIPQPGMPAVVTAPSGAPGVTVPRQDPPSKLTVTALRQADGEKLKADDHAVLKYTALLWNDSSVFDSTWTKGQAKVVTLTPSETVTKGLVDGLTGQRIGSQVLIVVPPEEGFGSVGSTGVPPESTLIYVVDILGAVG